MEETQSKRELNKANKKAAFLEAAEKLFEQKGFENTSIDEVTREAGLTKRTLYQYFRNKEDLYYAVALKGARLLFVSSEEAIRRGGSALEKIRLANLAHLRFYTDYPGLFRILNARPANRSDCDLSPHYREIETMEVARMRHLMDLVAMGKADGSINAALDPKTAIFFAFYASFSLLYTISSTDKGIWNALQLEENEFLHLSFDLITDAIK